jgi:hypothetical protein
MKSVTKATQSLTNMQLVSTAGRGSLETAKKAIEITGNKAADAKSRSTSKAASIYNMPHANYVKGYVLAPLQ